MITVDTIAALIDAYDPTSPNRSMPFPTTRPKPKSDFGDAFGHALATVFASIPVNQ
jgi:hypothetical protein